MRVYIGLGSNLGDRMGFLDDAVDALRAIDPDLVSSPTYETAPVGGPDGQGPYLNRVVGLETSRGPRELLLLARKLETDAGRVRVERWGPRTLDVDLLVVEGVEIDEEDLVVPHPRIGERPFVLAPLEDLAPDLVPPDWRERLGGADGVARAVWRVEGEHARRPPDDDAPIG